MKRLISLLLAMVLLISVLPIGVFAAENPVELESLQTSRVNPLYDDLGIELEELSTERVAELDHATKYHTSVSSAGKALRTAMENRETDFTIGFVFDRDNWTSTYLSTLVDDMLEIAFAHTGVSTQGDYIMYHYSRFGCSARAASYDSEIVNGDIIFTFEYQTSAAQEKEMTSHVNALLETLQPKGTDYNKMLTVYSWMCANITYDYANLNDSTYLLKHSAYAALVDRTAVCSGYALLFYRLCLEMGIDCRYISGFANGGNHGWNIAKLGDYYYNLDSTWDAGSPFFRYFLVSPDNFQDHTPRDRFLTSEFENQYPMGSKNYEPTAADLDPDVETVKITKQPKTGYAKLGKKASTTVTATGDGLTYAWYVSDVGDSKYYLSSIDTPTYSVKMTEEKHGRKAYCVVTDAYGNSVKSKTVVLRMAASIKTQPKNVVVAKGETAKVTFKAVGDGLKYTWYYKNAGDDEYTRTNTFTGNTYTISSMDASRHGRKVLCKVTDKYGKTVKTNSVTISMEATITQQPKTSYAKLGKTNKITVKAVGDGLKYTWYYKNPGASKFSKTSTFTGNTYHIASMDKERSGRQVYCKITDKYGNTVKTKTVTLRLAASVATQPKSVVVAKGERAKITFKAAGDGLKYEWYYKDTNMSSFKKTTSFTGNSYTVSSMDVARHGRKVYCKVTDKYGNTVKTKTVSLNLEATITSQPKSVTVAKGKTAAVQVKAVGNGLTYKWYVKNAGATKYTKSSVTGSKYSVTMSSAVSGRRVYCVVTDKYGNSVKSNTVILKKK